MDLLQIPHSNDTPITVTYDDLQASWNEILDPDNYENAELTQIMESVFLRSIDQKEDHQLDFIKGGWTIKLQAGIVKVAIGYAVMAGIFTSIGVTGGLALTILPSILPFIFEIEKIELNKKEKLILAKLLIKDEVKTRMHSPEQLYSLLPDDIKMNLNYLDFQDFLQKVELAGHKDTATSKVYRLSERANFKLTIL